MKRVALALLAACGATPTPIVANTARETANARPTTCERCLRLTSLVDLDGQRYAVPAGQLVVLSFFAVHIEGKLDVLEDISLAAPRYNGRAQFLSVAVSDLDPANIRAYTQRRSSTLPVVLGTDEVMAGLPEGAAMVVPTTLVFDRHGALVDTLVGKDEHAGLVASLDHLLRAP